MIRADGTSLWVRVHATRVGMKDGMIEVVALLTDVTSEKEAEAAAIASARLATLGEMASGLAHEMNQPLTVISLDAGVTAMQLQQPNPLARLPALLECQQRIVAMTKRARMIIDHLRMFARQQEADLEMVDLRAVVEGACLMCAGPMSDAGVVLRRELPADLPLVSGRQVLLEQVLVNLLLNAAQAMATTTLATRQVHVRAAAKPDGVTLEVADTGPGLAPEVLEKLFNPFFTTKPPGQGTGLGLSISHGIMMACGGTIAASNRPEGGAIFRLTLRLAEDGEADIERLPPPETGVAAGVG